MRVVEKRDRAIEKHSETFISDEDSDEYPLVEERASRCDAIKVNTLSSSNASLSVSNNDVEKTSFVASQIEQSKIQIMQKIKTKKLKKRLSMNHRE